MCKKIWKSFLFFLKGCMAMRFRVFMLSPKIDIGKNKEIMSRTPNIKVRGKSWKKGNIGRKMTKCTWVT